MPRIDGRKSDDLRPVTITTGFLPWAEGSAMIELGGTQVLCAASMESRLPAFLRGTGSGWVTAEYGMLPRSTKERTQREAAQGRQSGRSQEIQRLIGRALRAVTNLDILGERTFTVDCDVLKADGGTRTAAITGSYVALHQAFQKLVDAKEIASVPLSQPVAATSVGIVEGVPLLDLCYEEDARAEVDFNVIMTGDGRFVELQATAEQEAFSQHDLEVLLALARKGIDELLTAQQSALAATASSPPNSTPN